MRHILLLAGPVFAGLLAACTGYRDEHDSEELRRDIDDRTLESRVRLALASDPETGEERIQVSCRDGVVYLRGTLIREGAGNRAETVAKGVEGVRKVIATLSQSPSASE